MSDLKYIRDLEYQLDKQAEASDLSITGELGTDVASYGNQGLFDNTPGVQQEVPKLEFPNPLDAEPDVLQIQEGVEEPSEFQDIQNINPDMKRLLNDDIDEEKPSPGDTPMVDPSDIENIALQVPDTPISDEEELVTEVFKGGHFPVSEADTDIWKEVIRDEKAKKGIKGNIPDDHVLGVPVGRFKTGSQEMGAPGEVRIVPRPEGEDRKVIFVDEKGVIPKDREPQSQDQKMVPGDLEKDINFESGSIVEAAPPLTRDEQDRVNVSYTEEEVEPLLKDVKTEHREITTDVVEMLAKRDDPGGKKPRTVKDIPERIKKKIAPHIEDTELRDKEIQNRVREVLIDKSIPGKLATSLEEPQLDQLVEMNKAVEELFPGHKLRPAKFGGKRDLDMQFYLYLRRWSNASGFEGKAEHMESNAIDVQFVDKNGNDVSSSKNKKMLDKLRSKLNSSKSYNSKLIKLGKNNKDHGHFKVGYKHGR